MSNLALLMKNNFINETGINKIKYADEKEKMKAIGMVLLISFSMITLSIYGFIACFYLSDFLIQINQMELLLILGILGATLTTFFTSLYKASSYIFQSRDYEMLASLPIKQSTILSSKILMLIANNYLFSAAFILIPGIVYFIKIETGGYYLLYLIISTLAAPLIPTVIASLLAFVITNISSRSKKNNLISIVLNLLLIVVVLVLSFNSQNVMMSLIENSSSIIEVTQKLYLPAYFFVDALTDGDILSLIVFLLDGIIPIALFVYLFAKNFSKMNGRLSETYKANNYKFKELKSSSPVIALFNKEVKRYFSSNVYVMNTFVGMIMLVIFTGAVLLVGYDKIAEMLEISVVKDLILVQTLGITVFCLLMTNTSCVSISLEGKNLWILKSSPIKEMDIFKSKILLNLALTIPISIICFMVLSFKLSFNVKSTVLVIIAIVLLAIFGATLGILINLLYPKLDFINDVAVVKRGASVLLTMIGNMLYVVVLCGIGHVLKIDDINRFLILGNVITVIAVFILYRILKVKGVKMFRSL